MPDFKKRSYQEELLDQDNIPFEAIRKNMEELNLINIWLGGHQVSIKGLKELVVGKSEVTICEIGCGGGDNITALNRWCNKHNIKARFVGIDIKPECIDFAKSKANTEDAEWRVSDYKIATFSNKPDIIFSSLFCHHFTDDDLTKQLQWMQVNSKIGFFINDLHRHPLAYFSIKFLTSVFSSSYLVKNDAPLSVARGFTKEEWKKIFDKAGIKNNKIKWKWAFRYLITCKHE